MFGIFTSTASDDVRAKLEAVESTQAVIEFGLDGTIVTANANFLKTLGYTLAEIQGKHHRMFVEPAYANTPEYNDFWVRLGRGEAQTAQFKRIAKGGREVWIEASYVPLRDKAGRLAKVVKFAIDVTAQKMEAADLRGQVEAIRKSQAVIEFDLDGSVLTANKNFLDVMGYALAEIQGKPHSMFVDPAFAKSADYTQFWQNLRQGQYQAAQYKRIGKNGREVWIEASYNPIFDLNGKPYKVVKFATDITEQVALLTSLKRLIDTNFAEIDGAILQSTREAQDAARAAGETSSNVQMVASAAEELAASIAEISSSMEKSRAATDNAFNQTAGAGDATRRLAEAASAMGGIVSMITTIASQINLLALNATIESARAGEAGKGFAVVANEVKNLANQAAKATEQISREIDGIQSISEDVVGALEDIRLSIDTVRDHVGATASAVEEQSAVTRSMSSNMQGASTAVAAISQNIGEISAAVLQAQQAVGKTKEAAQVLAR